MADQIFYTKHAAGVTIVMNGFQRSVSSDTPTYPAILTALRAKDWKTVKLLTDIRAALSHAVKLAGSRIRVENDNLVYVSPGGAEHVINGNLTERAIKALNNGASADTILPLMRFMDNIGKNPKADIRQELYEFMAAGKMPITEDGCLLAYKRIGKDYKDLHSRTMDNSPGKVVSMPADQVDANRNNECSRGLHFCAGSYLGAAYGGDSDSRRTVIVKVNPRHVFAIPRDYSFAKGRCSEYYVVGEAKFNPNADELFKESYVFDETKLAAVAQVEFVETGLKAGIVAMAEGYGLVADGKVLVAVTDGRGNELELSKRFIVHDRGDKGMFNTLTGKPVKVEQTKLMSVDTKSVRPLLARAVARHRNRRITEKYKD